MSFNIGLSGMRAATKDLSVTGNNIANAGTVGFKQSRAEFADVYAASMLGNGKNQIGSGVLLGSVSQLFNQGNINYTQNPLDLAINGKGFFQVSNNGALSYTRAGFFGTDRDGFIVDNFGNNLQGYVLDEKDQLREGVIGNLQIKSASQEPRATSDLRQSFNLNSTLNPPVNWQSVHDGVLSTAYETSLAAAGQTAYTDSLNQAGQDAYDDHLAANPLDTAGADAERLAAMADTVNIEQAEAEREAAMLDPAHITAAEAARDAAKADAVATANAAFDPTDAASYSSSTSTNVYDSQGNAHVLTQYFIKTDSNQWRMNILIDGRNPANPGSEEPYGMDLVFTKDGKLDSISPVSGAAIDILDSKGRLTLQDWVPAIADGHKPPNWSANGASAAPQGITLDMREASQYASSFAVTEVAQNGHTTGELSGIEIDETGKIFARYTNGQTKVQGQVILVDFANVQGLTPIGKTQWVQSLESGEPVPNPGGTGTLGVITAGALEDSNVELSDQLVNLIVAQRNYQANAKTIETESAITQTIINIR